jgi:hypothetical protein
MIGWVRIVIHGTTIATASPIDVVSILLAWIHSTILLHTALVQVAWMPIYIPW